MASGGMRNRGVGANADIPAQPMHANPYKWKQSDADFVRLQVGPKANNIIRTNSRGIRVRLEQPKVVDSVSCRQMFLRSYTFSRKESFPEKTKKRFTKLVRGGGLFQGRRTNNKRQCPAATRRKTSCLVVVRRAKEASCAALMSMFRHSLFCTARVDVIN